MTYASTVLADSPIGYWRLGEASGTVADNAEGTAALDGTYGNTPTLGATGALTGDADTAMGPLNGTNQSVDCTNSTSYNVGDTFTVEAWVYRGATGAARCIVGKGDAAWTLRLSAAGVIQALAANAVVWESDAAVSAAWHHIVYTKSGATAHVYVDGSEPAHTLPASGTAGTSAHSLYIGLDPDNAFWSNATIDEVAFYGTALSSSQVSAHYAAGTTSGPTWTTPADSDPMSTTPELQFNSPTSGAAQHFYLELDTANTFDTGSLRTYRSDTVQTNWTYWDGDSWEPLPSTGLPSGMSGNEIRYTVTSALTATTWYRRVRAGTLA